MYSYTRSHIPPIPPSQSVPIISPPVIPATPLQGVKFYEYHHQYSPYEPQPSPRLERRPSQAYVRPSAVPGPYSPTTPSAEFAALYMRDAGPTRSSHARSHSRGCAHAHTSSRTREPSDDRTRPNARTHTHTHTKGRAAHIPTTSRTQAPPRPAAHREHRERKTDRERERGRTLHRHERRPSISEASHVATLGGTSTRGHTTSHSTRPSPAYPSRQHRHQQQPTKTNTVRPTAPAHKHASSQNHRHASQSHARDHRSHVHAHTNEPPNSHGHTYPSVHHHQHHDGPQLGVAYVPTAPPSNPQLSRSPRDYSQLENEERRARSQSAPRHRTLRPGRSAMRDRYNSRSRSRVRFGQEKRPQKPIAIPVGGRSKSRKQGVDFGWLRVPR